MYAFLVAVHVVFVVLWVGGMIFAWSFQRPAAGTQLEGPQRLRLWVHTFRGFFPWVWASVILLPVTGYWVIFGYMGGMGGAPLYVHLMNGLGFLMIALYLHVFFAPYRKLKRAVEAEDWQEGGRQLGRIRRTVGINFSIGLVVIVIATAGSRGLPVLQ
ncbi:CopD family protein [Thiohalorhabdus methylotrophus]|uniref:CopD family protein n=1 Tax=Thiohalorhabdus methylotrophus TaxID=3242694 RepID=A0ABV4TUP1_9GAMM